MPDEGAFFDRQTPERERECFERVKLWQKRARENVGGANVRRYDREGGRVRLKLTGRTRYDKPATAARETALTSTTATVRKAVSGTDRNTDTTPTVLREHGDNQRNTQHELDTANALTKQIGGNAVLLDNSGSVTKPDLDWNGQKWKIKSAGSANAIDKQTQKALRQAATTGSGIIIDCQTEDAEEAQRIVIHRLDRSARGDVPVIIMHRGEVIQSFTYKKKTE